MTASAIVYRISEDPSLRLLVLRPIGEAVVQPDGTSLIVHIAEKITLGPEDRILIKGT